MERRAAEREFEMKVAEIRTPMDLHFFNPVSESNTFSKALPTAKTTVPSPKGDSYPRVVPKDRPITTTGPTIPTEPQQDMNPQRPHDVTVVPEVHAKCAHTRRLNFVIHAWLDEIDEKEAPANESHDYEDPPPPIPQKSSRRQLRGKLPYRTM
jgi:hypothetical protein